MSHVEPVTQVFLNSLLKAGGPPLNKLSIQDARNVLVNAQSGNIKISPVEIEDHDIPCGPDKKVNIRIFKPTSNNDKLPAFIYFHGGGWILGDKHTHYRLMCEIAHGANVAVVFINYDRSPEVQYPVAIEQLYGATKYISEHGGLFNLDISRIVIGGDSVGGNMTAAVTLLAKERKGPKIDFQILLYPVTDANFDTGSYNQFATGYFLTKEAMKWFWDAYLPDRNKRNEPTASPLQASLEQLNGLPPALVITGENDVLRDEGEAYARKLMNAGVNVTAIRFQGTIHDFVMLNAITETPAARGAIACVNDKLRSIFGSVTNGE